MAVPSTRQTQPYRKGARAPGAALTAMLRGRSLFGANPQDSVRASVKMLTAAGKRKRPQRPARPARPQRPAR